MRVGYSDDRGALLKRLSRIEGQVRGISRMVEEESYCVDVLTQVGAVKSALDQVALRLLRDHITHCVTDSVRAGEAAKVEELVEAVGRFARS